MTQETPAKVFSLLSVALTSMFFLFAVAAGNASFEKVERPFPDPFAPAKVVAFLDQASNSYSKFVYANLIKPGQRDYALAADNLAFIGQEAGPQLMAFVGTAPSQGLVLSQGKVAGASSQNVVSQYYPSEGIQFNMNSLYSFFVQ